MLVQIGDLYALAGAATFAISSAMIKRLNLVGNASQLNFLRTLIGAVLFPLHLIIIGQFEMLFDLSGLIILYLAFSVIFNVVIGDTAFFEAQNRLGVKIATPLVNTYPYFTILFAVLLLDEEVTSFLIVGSLILIPGIILLSLDTIAEKTSFVDVAETNTENSDSKDKNRITGLILIFLAIGCYTAGIIFTTIATRDIGPVLANSVRLPVGAISLFLLSSMIDTREKKIQDKENGWKKIFISIKRSSKSEKIIIIIAGIFGTYLSSLFLVLSVQAIGASRSSILFSTGPFFALPLAVIWLHEKVGWKTVIGTILTVIGLWIILI